MIGGGGSDSIAGERKPISGVLSQCGGIDWVRGACSGGLVVGGYLSLSEICMHMIGTVENNGGGGGGGNSVYQLLILFN